MSENGSDRVPTDEAGFRRVAQEEAMKAIAAERRRGSIFRVLASGVVVIAVTTGIWLLGGKLARDLAESEADAAGQEAYADALKTVENLRVGCERANDGLRDPLGDLLVEVEDVAGLMAKRDVRKRQELWARLGAQASEQLQNMVDAAANNPEFEGSYIVACDLAYPLPDPPQ